MAQIHCSFNHTECRVVIQSMPMYQAVHKDRFSYLSWDRPTDYNFAVTVQYSSLMADELPRACLSFPIGFVVEDGQYSTAALLSLGDDRNLFVGPKGQWIAPYIPAQFRAYPFALSQIGDDRYALCVDMASGLIGEHRTLPFFEPQGTASKPVGDILDFLLQLQKSRAATRRMCSALNAEGLIVPWEFAIKGKIDIYRVDEAKLNSLDAAALSRIHQAGALPVAYCHLLSMQHIRTLAQLAEVHAKFHSMRTQAEIPDAMPHVGLVGDGKIDFSGFN